MRKLLLTLLLALPCFALQYGKELVSGTIHAVWLQEENPPTRLNPGASNLRRGLWVNLHSDDPNVVLFHVTLRYRRADGIYVMIKRDIDNDPWAAGSWGYWVSNPVQCIFWVGWPDDVSFVVSEERQPTDFVPLDAAK